MGLYEELRGLDADKLTQTAEVVLTNNLTTSPDGTSPDRRLSDLTGEFPAFDEMIQYIDERFRSMPDSTVSFLGGVFAGMVVTLEILHDVSKQQRVDQIGSTE